MFYLTTHSTHFIYSYMESDAVDKDKTGMALTTVVVITKSKH